MSRGGTGRLSLETLPGVPAACRPLLEPEALTVGVVHLGVGAFHRAHMAVYTERAAYESGDHSWGICGVSERSPAAATALAEQDGLYAVQVVDGEAAGGEVTGGERRALPRVVASLREAVFAGSSPGDVVARIADARTRIVSLTVTEKGYRHDPATGRLARDDREVAADAAGRPPATVVGQLARGLEARMRSGAGPVTVLSCDNLPRNGALLSGLVGQVLAWPGGSWDTGVEEWVATYVRFPCSMVDRMVPVTTPALLAEVERALGVRDAAAVAAEPFSQWVLEDAFAGERPEWERAGVELVPDVAPYEALKLRALNGAHSALAYLGMLAGIDTIAEAVVAPGFAELVRQMIDQEVAPTLELPAGVSVAGYREEVLQRFANGALGYRCAQVAADGSQKLGQRTLAVLRARLVAGASPWREALVVAAWLWSLLRSEDDAGRPLEVSDPLAGRVRELVGETADPAEVASRVLGLREVFGEELGGDPGLRSLLARALGELQPGRTAGLVAAFAGSA